MPVAQGSTGNAGRMVLVDLDDLERMQNHQHLTKGVAAAAVDARCGFIGTAANGVSAQASYRCFVVYGPLFDRLLGIAV